MGHIVVLAPPYSAAYHIRSDSDCLRDGFWVLGFGFWGISAHLTRLFVSRNLKPSA